MNTSLNIHLANSYKSNSQKIRLISETWVGSQVFCPNCGSTLNKFENNRKVADFFCMSCSEEYELKSKSNNIGRKIVDGEYHTMIDRLSSNNNPNFFFLTYDKSNFEVVNFFVIPKHFFIPRIIEKRKPLSQNARRAGWVGCNILLINIPNSGKIYYIKNKAEETQHKVLENWNKTMFLRETKRVEMKGWLMDVMSCIDKINLNEFELKDVYKYEKLLSQIHPENKHIKDKIRQQLQVLRDKGYLKFMGNGKYKLA